MAKGPVAKRQSFTSFSVKKAEWNTQRKGAPGFLITLFYLHNLMKHCVIQADFNPRVGNSLRGTNMKEKAAILPVPVMSILSAHQSLPTIQPNWSLHFQLQTCLHAAQLQASPHKQSASKREKPEQVRFCIQASSSPEGIAVKQDTTHPSQRAEVGNVGSAKHRTIPFKPHFLKALWVDWKNSRFHQVSSKLRQHSWTMTVIWISCGQGMTLCGWGAFTSL